MSQCDFDFCILPFLTSPGGRGFQRERGQRELKGFKLGISGIIVKFYVDMKLCAILISGVFRPASN